MLIRWNDSTPTFRKCAHLLHRLVLVHPLKNAVDPHLVEVAALRVVLNFKLREHRDEVPQLLGVRVILLRPHSVEHPRRLVGKLELAELLQLLRVAVFLHRQEDRLELLIFNVVASSRRLAADQQVLEVDQGPLIVRLASYLRQHLNKESTTFA